MGNSDIGGLLLRVAANRSMLSENTRKSYAVDWSMFTRWCRSHSQSELPATSSTLITYLSERIANGGKVSSAVRAVSAVNRYHRSENCPVPGDRRVYEFLTGVRRLQRERPSQKHPLSVEDLKNICSRLGSDPRDVRARAILTLGFASALRRSNIVALNVEDVSFVAQGVTLRIAKEKTDQEGKGRIVGVVKGNCPDTCPVRALEQWLGLRGATTGPLFVAFDARLRPTEMRLAAPQVALAVKRGAVKLGFDWRDYGGHSLRSGFVTAAVLAGCNEFTIAEQTGHASLLMLRKYFRNADPFARNASAMLGL
jgi:integrase